MSEQDWLPMIEEMRVESIWIDYRDSRGNVIDARPHMDWLIAEVKKLRAKTDEVNLKHTTKASQAKSILRKKVRIALGDLLKNHPELVNHWSKLRDIYVVVNEKNTDIDIRMVCNWLKEADPSSLSRLMKSEDL